MHPSTLPTEVMEDLRLVTEVLVAAHLVVAATKVVVLVVAGATNNSAPTPATSEDKEAQVTVILFARSASSGVIWLRTAGIATMRIMSPTNAWSQQL
jgi:hypothetical protein